MEGGHEQCICIPTMNSNRFAPYWYKWSMLLEWTMWLHIFHTTPGGFVKYYGHKVDFFFHNFCIFYSFRLAQLWSQELRMENLLLDVLAHCVSRWIVFVTFCHFIEICQCKTSSFFLALDICHEKSNAFLSIYIYSHSHNSFLLWA